MVGPQAMGFNYYQEKLNKKGVAWKLQLTYNMCTCKQHPYNRSVNSAKAHGGRVQLQQREVFLDNTHLCGQNTSRTVLETNSTTDYFSFCSAESGDSNKDFQYRQLLFMLTVIGNGQSGY